MSGGGGGTKVKPTSPAPMPTPESAEIAEAGRNESRRAQFASGRRSTMRSRQGQLGKAQTSFRNLGGTS